jgi:hypothetical protein
LALDIDDSDDWPLDSVLIVLDDFTDTRGERIGLLESYFAVPGTRKACMRIGNNTEESCVVVAKRCIRCKYRFRVARHG